MPMENGQPRLICNQRRCILYSNSYVSGKKHVPEMNGASCGVGSSMHVLQKSGIFPHPGFTMPR